MEEFGCWITMYSANTTIEECAGKDWVRRVTIGEPSILDIRRFDSYPFEIPPIQ